MNLAEFPITLLTDRVPKDQREAVYQDEIYDERSGLTLTRKLTISAGNHGLTTAVDDEVILALIQLTKRKNAFTERKVSFSRSELLNILGWSDAGSNYDRITTSLNRWTSVYLSYENAWRDNRTKTWKTAGFHIIERFELNDSRHSNDQLDLIPSFIVWNEVIFESFQAGYLKPLDYDLCMGLSNSTAKRMYRFLDKRFHHKPEWSFPLKEFAHEHIGLSRNYDGPAHLKRKLQPAIAELETIGFLESLSDDERFPKPSRDWEIRFVKQGAAPAPFQDAALPMSDAVVPQLVTELVQRGVTEATAAELFKKHPAEALHEKLDVLDWLKEKNDKKVAKSPAGYLVKSIQDSYAVPDGFIPKAKRQKQKDAQIAAAHKAAEVNRKERENANREKEDREAVDAYLKTLSAKKRALLEAKVLDQADDQQRNSYANPIMAKYQDTLMLTMLREYLAPILRKELEEVKA